MLDHFPSWEYAMNSYVELVPLGRDGHLRVPRHFKRNGASLRGGYVSPRLAYDDVVVIPVDIWTRMSEDALTHADTSIHARRLKRTYAPWAELTIDRGGRFVLPLKVRRRARLTRTVVLTQIVNSFTIKPESEFESELESVRRIHSEIGGEGGVAFEGSKVMHGMLTARCRQGPLSHPILQKTGEQIPRLTAEQLQVFVRECLWRMGLRCSEIGSVFARDGGVDLLAYSDPSYPFPVTMAVQVSGRTGTLGQPKVRDFAGTIRSQPVAGGILVTNTRFSNDARWFAQQFNQSGIQKLWLRDVDDLISWSKGDFRSSLYTDEIRSTFNLFNGGTFSIANGYLTRRW